MLILDEPTNDLDTDMLTAIEDLLDSWPGTLIVISHDRYLLERVTDQQYALLGDGRVRHLPRGIDQFLELRSAIKAQLKNQQEAQKLKPSPSGLSGSERRNLEKDLARVERALEKSNSEITELHARLAQCDQSDYQALSDLTQQLRAMEQKVENLELEWLATSEKLQD